MPKCELMSQPFTIHCDTYNCRQIAQYQIGNPEGPRSLMLKLCPDCAENLINSGNQLLYGEPEQQVEQKTEVGDSSGVAKTDGFTCELCGKSFEKEKGLTMHKLSCAKKLG